jgi:hypothetical protein
VERNFSWVFYATPHQCCPGHLEDDYDQHEAMKIPVHSSSDEILPSSQVPEPPAPMDTEIRSENSNVSPPESFPTDEILLKKTHRPSVPRKFLHQNLILTTFLISKRLILLCHLLFDKPDPDDRSRLQLGYVTLCYSTTCPSRLDLHPQGTFPKSLGSS